MRPAMIVVGLAALILVLFVTIGVVSTQSPAVVKRSKAEVAVPGVWLAPNRGRRRSPKVPVVAATQRRPQHRQPPGQLGPRLTPDQHR